MDLLDAIRQRYSYRGEFKDTPMPREDVETILKAGIAAPTGHNWQTPRFVALVSPEQKAKMAEIIPTPVMKTAQAVIVVLSQKKPMENGIDFEFADYAAATQNMLLAITALGYASVWIDGNLYNENKAQRVAQLVNAPEGLTPRVVLPIGVPVAEGPRKDRLPFEQRAFYDHF